MNTLKEIGMKFAKLLDVKSLVTLMLTFVFCYQTIVGNVKVTDFLTIFTVVIAFYFVKYSDKKDEGK